MRFLLKIAGLLLLLYIAVTALMYALDWFAGRRSWAGIKVDFSRKIKWLGWAYVGLAVLSLVWNLLLGEGRG
jgi:multisubunit Na+/H+ antiporter MnhB subunit